MSLIDDIKEMGVELTSEQESGITAYIGKHFVSKSDYNAKSTQLKEANGKIADLEKRDFASIEQDRDEWKQKFEGLQKDNLNKSKKEKFYALLGDDCKDKDYMLYKYGGVDKLELDDKENIKDADNIIKSLKENNSNYFGKTPFVVSSTAGSQTEPTKGTDKANQALRGIFGK
ncbi:hypothetical protein [Faecalitalea cylindroides]|uniref:phage scaffolding protein n=1 Tax=Faecalitalea cylindroides TaxID=39483 RepID=UPI0039F62471